MVMSRFGNYNNDWDGWQWAYIRWQGAKKQAFTSKYGRERLKEFREALLALPEKRLIQGKLVEEEEMAQWGPPPSEIRVGGVCAVGAYCAYKMGEGDMEKGMQSLLETKMPDLDYNTAEDTAEAGINAGLRYTMAWEFGFLNDELLWGEDPEQRYIQILQFIDKKLIETV